MPHYKVPPNPRLSLVYNVSMCQPLLHLWPSHFGDSSALCAVNGQGCRHTAIWPSMSVPPVLCALYHVGDTSELSEIRSHP